MDKKSNPIKRSEELTFLSHEHHHGLVFCARLKKANMASAEIIKAYVIDFWESHLLSHFTVEEQLFIPLLPENEIKQQFIKEHQQIKELVHQLLTEDSNIVEIAFKLSVVINDHIRFEERKMFPFLEVNFTENQLKEIRALLHEKEVIPPTFKPEFWKTINNQKS